MFKSLKWTLSAGIIAAMAASAVVIPATALAEGYSGTMDTGLTWTLENGTFTVTGDANDPKPMTDWDGWTQLKNKPWQQYKSEVVNVVIGEGVSHVGSYSFYEYPNLETVVMSEGVESIGERAFGVYNVDNKLKSVTFPSTLKTVGEQAFFCCTSIVDLDLSNTQIEVIGKEAFGCNYAIVNASRPTVSQMATVKLPDTVKTLEEGAFQSCPNLKEINLPEGLETIGEMAFDHCSLESLVIPDTVTSLGDYAFRENDFKEVEIPGSVKAIGAYAFSNCALENVTIDEGAESIGKNAFYLCNNLKYVTLPSTITTVGDGALSKCENLRDVTYYGNDPEALAAIQSATSASTSGTARVVQLMPAVAEVSEASVAKAEGDPVGATGFITTIKNPNTKKSTVTVSAIKWTISTYEHKYQYKTSDLPAISLSKGAEAQIAFVIGGMYDENATAEAELTSALN